MDQSEAWPMMPEEWPPRSLLGCRPPTLTAVDRWNNRQLTLAMDRRSQAIAGVKQALEREGGKGGIQ
jgi:hypothetical protein